MCRVVACLIATPRAQSPSTGWDAKFRELTRTENIRTSSSD
jgi:hypothetical protein